MKVLKSLEADLDIPHLDLLTFLFDSDWSDAKEDTELHIEAANPKNGITKSEARELVKRIAYVFRHQYGVGETESGKDIVLATTCGNPFVPIIFYSIVAAGGIYSGAGTAAHSTELIRQIKDAGNDLRLLLCTTEYESIYAEAAKECGVPADRILVLDYKVPKQWTLRVSSDRKDVLQYGNGGLLDWERIADLKKLQDTTTCLLYSSGTTGMPKGVRIAHWGLVANCVCTMYVARRFRAQSGNRGFSFSTIAHLPMANIAGISLYSTNPFYLGGTVIWMENFDFDTFIEYQRQYQPTYQYSVPPIWLRIAKSPSVTDQFNGLEVAVTGSAPIGYDTIEEVRTKVGKGHAYITQTWGATETCGVVTALDWRKIDTTWSVGTLCPNVTLRILDDNDEDVKDPGTEPGEFLIGGPILAQGYHNNPKANQETFVDGYYRTGDIGVYKDGLVYIMDRKKELIKYKGNQVPPAELEAVLTSHPKIEDAGVIGIWSREQETELPQAWVVKRHQTGNTESVTEQEVVDFVKENVSSYKQLRGGVVFVDEIPKSASGKILRKELKLRAEKPKTKL